MSILNRTPKPNAGKAEVHGTDFLYSRSTYEAALWWSRLAFAAILVVGCASLALTAWSTDLESTNVETTTVQQGANEPEVTRVEKIESPSYLWQLAETPAGFVFECGVALVLSYIAAVVVFRIRLGRFDVKVGDYLVLEPVSASEVAPAAKAVDENLAALARPKSASSAGFDADLARLPAMKNVDSQTDPQLAALAFSQAMLDAVTRAASSAATPNGDFFSRLANVGGLTASDRANLAEIYTHLASAASRGATPDLLAWIQNDGRTLLRRLYDL